MKFDYIVILAIMVVASYFLFIRKPKAISKPLPKIRSVN